MQKLGDIIGSAAQNLGHTKLWNNLEAYNKAKAFFTHRGVSHSAIKSISTQTGVCKLTCDGAAHRVQLKAFEYDFNEYMNRDLGDSQKRTWKLYFEDIACNE